MNRNEIIGIISIAALFPETESKLSIQNSLDILDVMHTCAVTDLDEDLLYHLRYEEDGLEYYIKVKLTYKGDQKHFLLSAEHQPLTTRQESQRLRDEAMDYAELEASRWENPDSYDGCYRDSDEYICSRDHFDCQ